MINQLVLEELDEDKKKKLKKLAIAGGLALAGGAGIQHLRNKLTQHLQNKELKEIPTKSIGNTAKNHLIHHSIGSFFGKKPGKRDVVEFGKDVAVNTAKDYTFHGIGHAVSNLRHGKNTFFNQQKKHNTQRAVTGLLHLGDFVHDAHKLYNHYITASYKRPSYQKQT